MSPGATSSSMPLPSSSQESCRRYCAAVSLAEVTAMVSAPSRAAMATTSSRPSTGTSAVPATRARSAGVTQKPTTSSPA